MFSMRTIAAFVMASGVVAEVYGGGRYVYEMIPGRGQIRYTFEDGDAVKVVHTGLSGRVAFDLNDDYTLTGRAFDLTLDGPFDYGFWGPYDWAPFAPGDRLADYLAVDFASAKGGVSRLKDEHDVPWLLGARMGPLPVNDFALGSYIIGSLRSELAGLMLWAVGSSDIGGEFRIISPSNDNWENPGTSAGRDLPNVRRVPEPSAIVVAALGVAFFFVVRRWQKRGSFA